MIDDQEKLSRIIESSIELAQINDQDVLLERILLRAREFLNADAGSIYTRDGDRLNFRASQNATLQKRLPPGKKLIYSRFSLPINNHSISGYVANTGEMVNIPDVYTLSPDVPYGFDRKYDELSHYCTQSILTVPLHTSRGSNVGVLQIINAQDAAGKVIPFTNDSEMLAELFASQAAVALERALLTRTLILRMIGMAEMRDPKETGAHVNRVAGYAVEIYQHWAAKHGIPADEISHTCDILRMSAMLHDVGKVAISDTILKKPGRFTEEEYEIMKQHTVLGARMFISKNSDFDDMALDIALNHHENWNGSGYPGWVEVETAEPLPDYRTEQGKAKGKLGEEIPLFGRIVSIADVYDALRSKRVYKGPINEEETLEMIRADVGKKFDPEVAEAFFEALDVIQAVSSHYPDEE